MTPDHPPKRKPANVTAGQAALRAALIYLTFATLWIVLSDRVLEWFVPNKDHQALAQTLKGLLFVIVTGVLFYSVIYTRCAILDKTNLDLKYSEEHYRATVENASVGIIEADLITRRFVRVNKAMCDITGYTEAELMAMDTHDLTHPDDREAEVNRFGIGPNVAEPAYKQRDKRYVRKDGRTIWVRVGGTLSGTDPKRPGLVVGVVQDITDEREAQERTRQREAWFRELADAMPQIVFTTDPDGVGDYYNRRWFEYTGLPLAHTTADRIALFHPDERDQILTNWAKTRANAQPFERAYRVLRASDQTYRWHLARVEPAKDAQGNVVKWFGTLTDIDDQMRAADEIRRLNETLEQRVQDRTAQLQAVNEELDAFSYTVSHDLRAPLQSLQAFARQLIATSNDRLDEDGQDALRRIVAMSARMERLIVDLLEYSRLARAELKPVPVSTVTIVHELVGQLERDPTTAKACVTFREPLPWVLGNRLILQQVFANLIANAVKFVKPGEAPRVNIWAEDVDTNSRIWIEDRGIGVDPINFERIFHPFEMLNPTDLYPGSGIGLAIVKRAVERMGGRVGLESHEGRGSRFWIELPKVQPAN